MENSDYLYVFLHIPKCGGSTIRKHIEKNYSPDQALHLSYPDLRFNPYQLTLRRLWKKVREDVGQLSENQKEKVRVIYGEEVPYGVDKLFNKKARYFTVIRNSVKRTISLYNFYRTRYERDKLVGKHRNHYDYQLLIDGKVPSFTKWLNRKYAVKRNSTESIHQLFDILGYAKSKGDIRSTLKKFYFIGISERSKDDFPFIYSMLDIKKHFISQNVSKKFIKNINSKTKGALIGKNRFDIKIYRKATEQNLDFKKSSSGFNKEVGKVKCSRLLLLPITQAVFDFKGLLISLSCYLRSKSKLCSKFMDNRLKSTDFKRILEIILIVLLVAYILVLPFRSLMYIVRIFREFTQPVEPYFGNIDPCAHSGYFKSEEEHRYYEYIKLGVICDQQ